VLPAGCGAGGRLADRRRARLIAVRGNGGAPGLRPGAPPARGYRLAVGIAQGGPCSEPPNRHPPLHLDSAAGREFTGGAPSWSGYARYCEALDLVRRDGE
jgi:hypothetical protein